MMLKKMTIMMMTMITMLPRRCNDYEKGKANDESNHAPNT